MAKIDEHHDRLVRLEEGVTEARVDIGILKSQVTDGFTMLSEKMDVVTELKERVDTIEVHERVRGRLLKIGLAVLTMVGGIAGFLIKIVLGG